MRGAPWLLALPVLLLAGCAPSVPAPAPVPTTRVPAFPTVPGRVVERAELAHDDWLVRVRVADAERAYADARRLLTDAGFVLTKDRAGTGGGDGQACTSTLCVGFDATEGPDGATVRYEVFRGGGVVG